ncbi:MAG: aminotransferase class I/II-fold pyridoxal phosphate-dependent enzyme [Candidatus Nanoarchaeia archaeon]|nr:aminotransferase class I/II-fold pyridoxal phosphate-dependent enzyme [Candidatus Nanoarchaeia archaeon]
MKRVLITGGAGFIGLHLAKHLAEDGYVVVIIDNFERGREDADFNELIKKNNVDFINGDITKYETFDLLEGEFDYVYHLAAINGTENFYNLPDKVLRVGILGTLNILEWFSKQKKGKLLFSSSSEAYAGTMRLLKEKFPIPTPENIPLTVEDSSNVRWSYGASKILSEVAIYSYAKSRGLDRFSIIRYHNIYGPRMGYEHVIPQFIERIVNEENPFKIYGGEETRTFCYIDDAVKATRMVMETESTNKRIIHIGRSDGEIKIIDIAKELFKISGFYPTIEILEAPEGCVKRRCPDTTKLKEIGFEAKVSLEDGLRKTFDWYNKKFNELIPVANTYIGEEEAKATYEVVKSGWIRMGKKVQEFEQEFAKITGAKHAIAVNNGTSALHVALAAVGIKEGDEVIIPTITFISTANAVIYQNAKPILAECDPKTYNITAEEIEKRITPRTKAIIPVDMNGMPIDYDSILEVARRHSIPVIADSAESLGASYNGRNIGSIAPIHIFSFFPNKNITTGEGGMITTNDDELAKKMRQILNQGQDYRYHHIVLGYNYRMTDIQAAIGIEQLKRLKMVVEEKEKLAKKYNSAFKDCKKIKIPHVPEYVTQHSWYMYAISVDEKIRDEVVEKLKQMNIETRLSFPPVHIQPYYQQRFGYYDESLPVSFHAWKALINIPLWINMGNKQEKVIKKIINLIER